jgi:hypothetical protein
LRDGADAEQALEFFHPVRPAVAGHFAVARSDVGSIIQHHSGTRVMGRDFQQEQTAHVDPRVIPDRLVSPASFRIATPLRIGAGGRIGKVCRCEWPGQGLRKSLSLGARFL